MTAPDAPIRPGDDLGGGLVAVPREATAAMLAAVGHYWGPDTGYCSPDDVRAIYRALIAAVKEG